MSETGPPSAIHPPLRATLARLWQSAVVWSWGFNLLRLGSGILLLPLVLRILPKADLGFYYVFLSLQALMPLMDMGLLHAIDRAISYATGGALELRAMGVPPPAQAGAQPNYALLWKLLHLARAIYRALAVLLFVILGALGTYSVSVRVQETTHPHLIWLAWTVTLVSTTFELYSTWWNIFLRAMNHVVPCWRILFFGYAIKFSLSCVLLLLGGGLLSIPLAGVVSSIMVRWWSRRRCLQLLLPHPHPAPTRQELRGLLRLLWPNSWRAGLQFLSTYLNGNANALVCLHAFGLAANAEYGLSLQIANLIQGMSLVWVSVKWPLVSQLRARHDQAGLQTTLRGRIWLQMGTFLVLAVLAVTIGPVFLEWIGSDKQILPATWFVLLLCNMFMETQVSIWTTLLASENRIPSLWPVAITNAASLLLVLAFVQFSHLGLASFVLAPLITGALFNFWHWPREGARNIGTRWTRFMFARTA
jgi:hypothetical protein